MCTIGESDTGVPWTAVSEAVAELAPYGADRRVEALFETYAEADLAPGRVARVSRIRCLVATGAGVVEAAAETMPAVGDWVGLRPGGPDGLPMVEVVLPRWSELTRRAAGPVPEAQVVAANVDVVFIVTALDREPNLNRIERELAVAWESGAQPVVVLNKADVSPDADGAADAVRTRLGLVDVVVASARTGLGVHALADVLLPRRTAVLLGASGVGKSTIVNALVGDAVAETGAVRENDGRGRHTTTFRSLLPVPRGGVLLDTPGIRSIGLWDAEEGVARTFPEIEALVSECRFRDCVHTDEPGCAVLAAVASGHLDTARFESWRKLQRELAYEARALDPRVRAEETKRVKAIHRSMRSRPPTG
jgi:ribosome biogenesis GTPase